MATLCVLCSTKESRYKCPFCYIPYCSLSCYKPHKESHTSDLLPSNHPTTSTTPSKSDPLAALLTSLSSPPTSSTPAPAPSEQTVCKFSPLLTNTHLHSLLRQNPSLVKTLYSIYASTVPPPEENENDPEEEERSKLPYFQKLKRKPEWTQEVGDKRGLKRLAGLRNANGVVGVSGEKGTLEEFVEIVLEAVSYGN